MFCPECLAEYREGFTRCPDCNRALVDRLPDPIEQAGDDAGLVRLRTYSNDAEAFLARSVLEAAGIEAMVSPPKQPALLPHFFGTGLPATDIYVRSDDFLYANEILMKAERD